MKKLLGIFLISEGFASIATVLLLLLSGEILNSLIIGQLITLIIAMVASIFRLGLMLMSDDKITFKTFFDI